MTVDLVIARGKILDGRHRYLDCALDDKPIGTMEQSGERRHRGPAGLKVEVLATIVVTIGLGLVVVG